MQDLKDKIDNRYRVRMVLDNMPITTFDLTTVRPCLQSIVHLAGLNCTYREFPVIKLSDCAVHLPDGCSSMILSETYLVIWFTSRLGRFKGLQISSVLILWCRTSQYSAIH